MQKLQSIKIRIRIRRKNNNMSQELPELETTVNSETLDSTREEQELSVFTEEVQGVIEEAIPEIVAETEAEFRKREEEFASLTKELGSDPQIVTEVALIQEKRTRLNTVFSKVLPNFVAKIFTAKEKRKEIPTPSRSFEDRVVARKQLEDEGITNERRSAYIKNISDFLYRVITPFGYKNILKLALELPANLVTGREKDLSKSKRFWVSLAVVCSDLLSICQNACDAVRRVPSNVAIIMCNGVL